MCDYLYCCHADSVPENCVPCYPLHSAHTSAMSANLILLYVNEQAGDSLSDSCFPSKSLLYPSTFSLLYLLNLLTTVAKRL